jgi:hypothetical protein
MREDEQLEEPRWLRPGVELSVSLSANELAFISRALLTHRVECPWDETDLADRLDGRLKQLLVRSGG